MLIRELGRWVVEVQFIGGNGYENGRWAGGMKHTRKTMEKASGNRCNPNTHIQLGHPFHVNSQRHQGFDC
jgi:hypothetical protein